MAERECKCSEGCHVGNTDSPCVYLRMGRESSVRSTSVSMGISGECVECPCCKEVGGE